MSGYSKVTSKPKRELFPEIKRFRASVEAGEPPIGAQLFLQLVWHVWHALVDSASPFLTLADRRRR
jgi:hypothetical protein